MQRMKLINAAMVVVALAASSAVCAADRASESKTKTPPSTQATPKAAPQTVVYYFHGTNRCHTCRTIEAYADEAVKVAFASELVSGEIQWKPTNIDEAVNEHFVQDYQLYTRSLVVVDGLNLKRFKNLEKVWQLVGDKPVFMRYVQDEVRAFRKP